MLVRLLKSYTLNTGKKLCVGYVFRRTDSEGRKMIENNIAEEYKGPFPPKKMKLNLKNLR